MKTTLVALLISAATTAALADNAPIGPDFVGTAPARPHIDRSLVASPQMNRIEPLDVVAFDNDSTHLRPESVVQLDRAARWISRHPKMRLVLEGHTDKLGTLPYNEDLATRRNEVVRRHLMARGVSSDRIVMITYGETQASPRENPNDRRVVLFASDRPVREVVTAQLSYRQGLVASWTEKGSLITMQNGVARQTREMHARRPTATRRR